MNSSLVLFDLETTSAKPSTCAAVQIGALHYNYAEQGVYEQSLFNEILKPDFLDSSDGATAVHGITPEMMEGKRSDELVLGEFYAWLAPLVDQIVVAGHACSTFDLPILWRIAGREPLPVRYIDTLVISRRLLAAAPGHKLGELYTYITGEEPVDAHDAAGDCRMVFRLIEYFCKATKWNIDELSAYCMEPRVLKYCTMGKHKGKLWGRGGAGYVPGGFVRWMCDNFDNPGPDLIATIREKYNMRFKNI